jgi:hypothetical protein
MDKEKMNHFPAARQRSFTDGSCQQPQKRKIIFKDARVKYSVVPS